MKQILQNLGNGDTELAEVPVPLCRPGHVLIQTRASVVSIGTERMLVEFGKANFLEKARQQPDKVRQVLEKVRTDGIGPTMTAVRSKLDQPLPLGYCNAGVVLEVGAGVSGLQAGDRVVSNGPHAQVVVVPENLVAKIPDGPTPVSDEAAAFTVLAAIGLQGIRLAQPTLGETFVVTGLGLIGLLTVQLLKAHGCKVIGIDVDAKKCELARRFGAESVDLSAGEDPVAKAMALTQGRGVDGVILAASTKSSEPVHQAALMCRKRGRIVLIGVTGLELSRADFYEKELTFQVSCSYGPGRYDALYEQKGYDYPFGLVRWTEQRNFEAVLAMLAEGRLDIDPLISHRFELAEAETAYQQVAGGNGALGVVLRYPEVSTDELVKRSVPLQAAAPASATGHAPRIGLIGAGNYTGQVLLPAIQASGAQLQVIASAGGVTGVHHGRKHGFAEATTDTRSLFGRSDVDAVVIATRHDTHAQFLREALEGGKHAFVEKPLAITEDQLADVQATYRSLERSLVVGVGFNRRFAPHVVKMKALLRGVAEPKTFVMTVNAGAIPLDHWTQDPGVGGGRIIGEACHFIDLLRFLAGAPIAEVQASILGGTAPLAAREDKMTLTLTFADGSHGTVHYFANGHKAFPKERLEVFAGGKILALDNFKTLTGYGWSGFTKMGLWNQDKGHKACMAAWVDAVRHGKPAPIPFDELLEVTRASFRAVEAARQAT